MLPPQFTKGRAAVLGDIAVYRFADRDAPPAAEFADIWPRLREVLRHQAAFNREQLAVRAQQHGIITSRRFLVPSPFGNPAEACDNSYFSHHRFFYRFAGGPEEFFWISAAHDQGYVLGATYFPRRRAAVTLYANPFRVGTIEEFEAMRTKVGTREDATPIAVIGFPHPIHMFWNEFSALEYAIQAGLTPHMRLATLYEPFGPTGALFPEFADGVRFVRFDAIAELNRKHRLPVGLGAWSIPAALQQRLRRFAQRLAPPRVVAARDAFRAHRDPVFWLSVKADKRTCLDQPAVLAALIGGIGREYPRAGFILDGTSMPWDLQTNPNYVADFPEWLDAATAATAHAIDALLAHLAPDIRGAVRTVSGVSVFEEIVWGEAADFYFCHGGTMAPKIGWIHRIPGLVHSNATMRERLRYLPPQVENSPPCFLLADQLQHDCPADTTGSGTIDVDYAFSDVDAVLGEILERFRSATGAQPAGG